LLIDAYAFDVLLRGAREGTRIGKALQARLDRGLAWRRVR